MLDDSRQPISNPKTPTLKISVKVVALGVQEHVDNIIPILKQASDALYRLKDPNLSSLPDDTGVAGSAVAGVGSILENIGKIVGIMNKLNMVRFNTVGMHTPSMMRCADSSLCEGGWGHP